MVASSPVGPVKIILIVITVLVLLLVAAGVGAYLWFEQNRERIATEGKAVMAEGEAFGRETDQVSCLTEAIRRLDACDGLMCEVKAKIFLEHCAGAARPSEGFCEGVPDGDEIMATVTWSLGLCEALGRPGDQPCTRLIRAIQEVCPDAAPATADP